MSCYTYFHMTLSWFTSNLHVWHTERKRTVAVFFVPLFGSMFLDFFSLSYTCVIYVWICVKVMGEQPVILDK